MSLFRGRLFGFEANHVIPRQAIDGISVEARGARALLESINFDVESRANKMMLFISDQTRDAVQASPQLRDIYAEAGFGFNTHDSRQGAHTGYNNFVLATLSGFQQDAVDMGWDTQQKEYAVFDFLHFLRDINTGGVPPIYGTSVSGFTSAWQSWGGNKDYGDLTENQIKSINDFGSGFADNAFTPIDDNNNKNSNPQFRYEEISKLLEEARSVLAPEKISNAENLFSKAQPNGSYSGHATAAAISLTYDLQRLSPTPVQDLTGIVEYLGASLYGFIADESGAVPIGVASGAALLQQTIDTVGSVFEAIGAYADDFAATLNDLGETLVGEMASSINALLVGVGGSIIGDTVEFLNLAYDAVKTGFRTGDWSDFGEAVAIYGAGAVAGALLVTGSVIAATSVVGAVSAAAAPIVGSFVAAGWAAYGLYDAVVNGVELFGKIRSDLADVIPTYFDELDQLGENIVSDILLVQEIFEVTFGDGFLVPDFAGGEGEALALAKRYVIDPNDDAQPDAISGTDADERFYGQNNAQIDAGAGNDEIFMLRVGDAKGGAGNDLIVGGQGEEINAGAPIDPSDPDSKTADTKLRLKLDGGAGNDWIIASGTADISGGSGNDVIVTFGGVLSEIFGGAGNDTIAAFTPGSVVSGGTGADTFIFSDRVLVTDATGEDSLSLFGAYTLTGGVGWGGRDTQWATGILGERYGFNIAGEMIVEVPWLRNSDGDAWRMFLANGNSGPNVAPADRTAGLLVIGMQTEVTRIWEADSVDVVGSFKANFGFYFKAMLGVSYFEGVDPLVLDLDGDGLELTAVSAVAPSFDMDADGFAERTGWVRPDDGFLVLDRNNNGRIDNVNEMFGSPTTSGFDELRTLDTQKNNVINKNDADFSKLRVWRDLDQDGVTDAGELKTLAQSGIKAIRLNATEDGSLNAGNVLAETATFVKTNNQVRTVADVNFRIDNFESTWLGNKNVNNAAKALPNIKGQGTLPDLHVAMSRSAALLNTVQAELPDLDIVNLATLKTRSEPILEAWAAAPPASAANAVKNHPDVHMLVSRDAKGATVHDFAINVTEGGQTFWKLASGDPVERANGSDIARPTLAQLKASPTPSDQNWEVLSGSQMAFVERYLGEDIPVENAIAGNPGAVEAFDEILDFIVKTVDIMAVRLAMQGPLSGYFDGISYNDEQGWMELTSDRGMAPMYEAIFDAAPGTVRGARNWLNQWGDIVDIVVADLKRPDGVLNTYSYQFQGIVAAYETVGLPIGLTDAAQRLGIPNNLIITGSGSVNGTSQADIFYMDASNQTVRGGNGSDAYVFGQTFGTDRIIDVASSEAPNVIRFSSHQISDLTIARSGLNLVITAKDGGGKVTVDKQFQGVKEGLFGGYGVPPTGVHEITFADGTVYDKFDIAKAVSRPTNANQTINGTPELDYMDGGRGNDILRGGSSGDIYIFNRGYGKDRIEDVEDQAFLTNVPDSALLGPNITKGNITLWRDGDSDDLTIKLNGRSDELTIDNQFLKFYGNPIGDDVYAFRIENFIFDDGSYYTADQIMERMVRDAKTDGADTIFGFDYEDVIEGGKGNDYLSGGSENDVYVISEGDGKDTIFDGNFDALSGQFDIVRFGAGISRSDISASRLDAGDDLIISIAGSGGQLTLVDQNQWFRSGGFVQRIEEFQFADGTKLTAKNLNDRYLSSASTNGNDTIYGFVTNDRIEGKAGNDYLSGAGGFDNYVFKPGFGKDTISENNFEPFSNQTDRVTFAAGLNQSDLRVTRSDGGDDITIGFSGRSDKLTIEDQNAFTRIGYSQRIEEFRFSDGTTLDAQDINDLYLDSASTNGKDTIYGFVTDDVIRGERGNDFLDGGSGSDEYVFARGDGKDIIEDYHTNAYVESVDTVRFVGNIKKGHAVFTRVKNDLIITFTNSSDQITVKGQFGATRLQSIEEFQFSNGTLTMADIEQLVITPTAEDDIIIGTDGNDTLRGGPGDDYMRGGEGDDTYIYRRGDEWDVIEDGGYNGNETLRIQNYTPDQVIATRSESEVDIQRDDLILTFVGTDDRLTIRDTLGSSRNDTIERFRFDDGTIWTPETFREKILDFESTDKGDEIEGFAANDILRGGLGNDYLKGDDGNDTYIFARGDGQDAIWDAGNGTVDHEDRVLFEDYSSGEALFREVPDDDYDHRLHLEISFTNSTDTVLVERTLEDFSNRNVELYEFADGTIWTLDDVKARLQSSTSSIEGTNAADRIKGTGANERIYGLGGNDILWGGAGRDRLDGGAGGDRASYTGATTALIANLTNPTVNTGFAKGDTYFSIEHLQGSKFADQLTGNGDNNTIWGWNGNDRIHGVDGNDNLQGQNNDDILWGGAGADRLDGGSGTDRASYTDATAAVKANLANASANTGYAAGDTYISIENLQGSKFNDQLWGNHLANTIWGWNGNDKVYGGNGKDTLYGQNNNDHLYGQGGNDQLYGGNNDDVLSGGAGADRLDGGSGTDRASYTDATAAVKANLANAAGNTGFAAGDTYIGIENIQGSKYADQLWGNGSANTIWGWNGNDKIYGGNGSDTLRGENNNDHLYGQGGNDKIYGGNNNDILWGGAGADRLDGGAGTDRASYTDATAGVYVHMDDVAQNQGWAKGDTYISIEHLQGSNHADTLIATSAANTIWGQNGTDEILGLAGNDTLHGGNQNDSLFGGTGNDRLNGNNGNDSLFGNGNNDVLNGGSGDDWLVGGGGNDVFEFVGKFGDDGIADFSGGAGASDQIRLTNTGLSNFAELSAEMTEDNGNVFIAFANGSNITLHDTSINSLHQDDFLF